MDPNYTFFIKTDLSGHIGEWVIIIDQKIVACGKNVKQIYTQVKQQYPKKKLLIAKVPTKEAMIF